MDEVLNPIAFSFGPIQVHWYGIILMTGALLGLYLVIREGKRFGIDPDFFNGMVMFGLPAAIIGARIYYVVFKWEDYQNHPLDIIKIWQGGIAIYGALIGALIAGFFYFRAKGYGFWRVADICAPGLLLGQMVGRWGNFINQEAHGGPVSETFLRDGLHLPNLMVQQMHINGSYYHPTFLYESIWSFAGLCLLLWLRRRPCIRAGELFLSYFIWYSIGRFFVEGLRTDSLAFDGPQWLATLMESLWSPMRVLFQEGTMSYGNIRISQLLGVIIILAAASLIQYRRSVGLSSEKYSDPIVARLNT